MEKVHEHKAQSEKISASDPFVNNLRVVEANPFPRSHGLFRTFSESFAV
jgi:hypothetical protein